MNAAQSDAPMLGSQGWEWLRDREMDLLPPPTHPTRLRWVWAVLILVLAGLTSLIVLIWMRL